MKVQISKSAPSRCRFRNLHLRHAEVTSVKVGISKINFEEWYFVRNTVASVVIKGSGKNAKQREAPDSAMMLDQGFQRV